MRMVACGQTITHLPHWMQIVGSHTGISSARLRFSHCAVPVGKVPSHGNALTGSSSPRPAMISPKHVAHERRRPSRHGAGALELAARDLAGTFTSMQVGQRVVHRLEVLLDDLLALLAVGLPDRVLDRSMASLARQHAGEGEETDLHDRVDAPAHAAFARDLVGVDHVNFAFLLDELLPGPARQLVPDLFRPDAAC